MTKGIDIAEQYLGCQQDRDNEKLRKFLRDKSIDGDIAIDPAETSWCAAFCNACERAVGNPGTGSLAALSFRNYGSAVEDYDQAKRGDICVFVFPFDSPGHGHVTYFEEWDDENNTVMCLGGNQNHSVNQSHYVQDYIVAIRRS